MHKHHIGIIILIVILSMSKKTINNNISIDKLNKNNVPLLINSKGSISIEKINLKYNLLDINDPNNNIESNVTIKDIDENSNYYLIMAHSGTGPKAFFKDLKYLDIGEKITIIYNNIKNNYYITSIERQEKTGIISVKKDYNTLVLTTCDINNKQLIIYAKK